MSKSRSATVAYIAEMTAGLAEIANENGMSDLAFLLNLASTEARENLSGERPSRAAFADRQLALVDSR
jgi:hypothetical protein